MAWHVAYDRIKPYIFRIDSEDGFGTGFLFAFNKDRSIAAMKIMPQRHENSPG